METAASIHPLPRTRASCPQLAGLAPATPGGPRPHLGLAGVPPDPLPSGGHHLVPERRLPHPPTFSSLLSCSPHGAGAGEGREAGGTWSQVCCWLSWGPPTWPCPPRGIPLRSLHPPLPGAVMFLLIPLSARAPPLPRRPSPETRAEPGVFTPPYTHP